ncbi:MAG: Gfo/Idh/MocA family oxidoreductase [Candidatus Paceibacterota bacterium]|nr:MAG: Gfo/Idh/MocA family oxidoreductase [Candidatus Paceibacterota bacterium]
MQETKNNTKILIIGFGSIGQRHYRNLVSLGYKNITVFDTDVKKIKYQKLKIKILDKKTLGNFDIAFICNPNHKHVEASIKCAEAGLHLFIEKPLSHDLKGVTKLEKLLKSKKLIDMVACNMRFHPAFLVIKKYIDSGKLGKIYSVDHEFGYYLPYWRPGTDYRKNYAAKNKMGGGIVLDDIHEFDLLFWINNFSPVKKHLIIKEHSGSLKIETEDIAKGIFQFKNGLSGSVSCDYLSKKYHRICRVVGEKGNLSWDWNENIVWLENEKSVKKIFGEKEYDKNEMYIEEVKYFLKSVKEKKKTFNDVTQAKEILKYLI